MFKIKSTFSISKQSHSIIYSTQITAKKKKKFEHAIILDLYLNMTIIYTHK